jgi:hypothetical protein
MLGNKMGADLESKHATATNRLPDFPARLSKNMDISWVLMVLTEKEQEYRELLLSCRGTVIRELLRKGILGRSHRFL